jgi:hypothetical protein
MGITGPDRREYWSLIGFVLSKMPDKFPIAITLTVYGYHFRRVAKLHLGSVQSKDTPIINMDTRVINSIFEKISI